MNIGMKSAEISYVFLLEASEITNKQTMDRELLQKSKIDRIRNLDFMLK